MRKMHNYTAIISCTEKAKAVVYIELSLWSEWVEVRSWSGRTAIGNNNNCVLSPKSTIKYHEGTNNISENSAMPFFAQRNNYKHSAEVNMQALTLTNTHDVLCMKGHQPSTVKCNGVS